MDSEREREGGREREREGGRERERDEKTMAKTSARLRCTLIIITSSMIINCKGHVLPS